jgi:hypothetical protein
MTVLENKAAKIILNQHPQRLVDIATQQSIARLVQLKNSVS